MLEILISLLLSDKPRQQTCTTSEQYYCLTQRCTTICKRFTCCLNGVCSTTPTGCKANPPPPVQQ